jgi:hypothetical protein
MPHRPFPLALALLLGAPLIAPAAADLAGAAQLPALAAVLDAEAVAEAAFIRRSKLKQRPSIGYKVVVVVGDDAADDEVSTVHVDLAVEDGGPQPLSNGFDIPLRGTKDNGDKRFVFNGADFDCDAVGSSVTITTTMLGPDGQAVGEPDVRTVTVQDDGDARMRSVRIEQVDDTNFQVRALVVGDDEHDVASVALELTDLIGNTPIPENPTLSLLGRNGAKATFGGEITFEDPASAADEPYGVVANLLDSNGNSLGASDYEIVVEGLLVAVQPIACNDGLQNGDEAGIDCGGSYCAPYLGFDDFVTVELASEFLYSTAIDSQILGNEAVAVFENKVPGAPIGEIAIDSIFTPIKGLQAYDDGTYLVTTSGYELGTFGGVEFGMAEGIDHYHRVQLVNADNPDGAAVSLLVIDEFGGLVFEAEHPLPPGTIDGSGEGLTPLLGDGQVFAKYGDIILPLFNQDFYDLTD